MSARVLVTGATGFVGSVLCEQLAAAGYTVRAAFRTPRVAPAAIAEQAIVGSIGSTTDWARALAGVEYIVHAAARAHVLNDTAGNADLYYETNARGTLQLATAAARFGVRRFVFVSSVKVNGEQTTDRPYRASDEPRPLDIYGQSKKDAEDYLSELSRNKGLEFAIVRPPLVHGPGVRANFLRLLRWVDAEKPVPLGLVHNRRSLVSVWNLSDLIVNLLTNPMARNGIWLVSDGHDWSTPDLIRQLAASMGRRARLLPVPLSLLRLVGALTGTSADIHRVCSSLCVDVETTRAKLGWKQPLTSEEGLARTVKWYVASKGASSVG